MLSMPTLRLTQTAVGEDLHRVEIAHEEEGRARETSLRVGLVLRGRTFARR
ncbi:MAG TPA: hypothetical protein VFE33_12800 [Thermoanaerobaculia bacterium]|nr:hypothetical protein [Thermoanaerobaculia bacterium]